MEGGRWREVVRDRTLLMVQPLEHLNPSSDKSIIGNRQTCNPQASACRHYCTLMEFPVANTRCRGGNLCCETPEFTPNRKSAIGMQGTVLKIFSSFKA